MKVGIGKYPKKGEQKINVRIDPWDTWNMDRTLALIIHPMLTQLQTTKMGSPGVDDEDVPENLKSTSAPPKKDEWDVDDNHHLRWNWIIDEMIFAFYSLTIDWEEPFFKEGKYDQEGHTSYNKRMNNGFRLFGKYYTALWD